MEHVELNCVIRVEVESAEGKAIKTEDDYFDGTYGSTWRGSN
jgi:hypothetical protein